MHEIPSFAVEITRITKETPNVRTFEFSGSLPLRPGQFCMVWVPGVDEIPMALSAQNAITVQRVGEATSALFSLSEGDSIGIRGPLGNGFELKGNVLCIGGGIGAAPLRPIAIEKRASIFLLGARTAEELVFADWLEDVCELKVATDDGTRGYHGFVTQLLEDTDPASFDTICVCGPEVMMKAVFSVLEKTGCADRAQFSLVRYMKCGVGICGSCCIDPSGLRVCRDGPVFPGSLLKNSEFGKYSRDAAGRRIPF